MNTNEIIIDDLKYQTYDEYIDSEIEWLGKVPNHYEIKRIKNEIEKIISGGTPTSTNESFWNGNINWCSITDISKNKFLYQTKKQITKNGLLDKNLKIIEKDVLLYTVYATIGKTSITKIYTTINQAILAIYCKNKLNQYYLQYFLKKLEKDIYYFSNYTTQYNLSLNIFNNIINILPSKKEQLSIVKFLDKKIDTIDKKISILERKNTLINELEQSIINQCVTKGVDSFTKLDSNENLIDFDNKLNRSKEEFDLYMNENGYKNSEIEWLGYINQNYNITKFKKFFKSNMGNVILKEDLIEDGLYPVYSATAEDKYFGYINDIKLILNKNDLVIPARGNSIGFVKIVKELSTSTQTTIVSKTLNKINSLFIFYFLNVFRKNIFAYDESTIPQFTVEQTNNIIILSPTKQEQLSIVKFLDNKIKQFKLQKDKINKEIELLKEYKKTLINDVVTGKIKVTKD